MVICVLDRHHARPRLLGHYGAPTLRVRWWSVSPPKEFHFMVVLVPEVHNTEDLGGFGVLYHDHVALGVVGLYGHAQVIARLVFVSHLQCGLYRGLLLSSTVATQLQRVVGVEAPWSKVAGTAHAPEDGP